MVKKRGEHLAWKCRSRVLDVGVRTYVMGIVNVTPDSFSDGGSFVETDRAVAHALDMLSCGADIVDVGGESTRPGADTVSAEEECQRVVPVVRELRRISDCLISVDTMKSVVADQALIAGADIINDVSALSMSADMVDVVAQHEAGVILMHMQGRPKNMQDRPMYHSAVDDIVCYLQSRVDFCLDHQIAREQIVLDPGIGFGKTVDHNVQILAGMESFKALGYPLLAGLSRKSFLGHISKREVDDRLAASLAGMVCAIERGANILRVHDVKESCDAARIVDRVLQEERNVFSSEQESAKRI